MMFSFFLGDVVELVVAAPDTALPPLDDDRLPLDLVLFPLAVLELVFERTLLPELEEPVRGSRDDALLDDGADVDGTRDLPKLLSFSLLCLIGLFVFFTLFALFCLGKLAMRGPLEPPPCRLCIISFSCSSVKSGVGVGAIGGGTFMCCCWGGGAALRAIRGSRGSRGRATLDTRPGATGPIRVLIFVRFDGCGCGRPLPCAVAAFGGSVAAFGCNNE